MDTIKITLVDDHQIFRDGFKSLFIGEACYQFISEASSATELYGKLKYEKPDVLFVDIELPKITGIEITKEVKKLYPEIKLIILSADKSEYSITTAIKAGADGYLHKDTSIEEIKNAITTVLDGGQFFGESVASSVFRGFANRVRDNEQNTTVLSDREIEIIKLISQGNTYKEIGEKLFISTRTVESHKNKILKKLELNTLADLICFAIKHNYISV
ncbi:MAG: response regulator transcription factor [Prolixibacteraceae bacterium]|nr:response regulator transcription factor [Prolixibacteraceae bacterium]